MFIVSSDKSMMLNTDNVMSIAVNHNSIEAYSPTGKYERIGVYEDKDRAKEVFDKLCEEVAPCVGTLYLPEE